MSNGGFGPKMCIFVVSARKGSEKETGPTKSYCDTFVNGTGKTGKGSTSGLNG